MSGKTDKEFKKYNCICCLIPSLGIGGMQRVMYELVNYFSTNEYLNIHLIIYGNNAEIYYSFPDRITIHKSPFRKNHFTKILLGIQTLRFIRNEIERLKPDSILSFGEYWNSFVLLALLGINIPVYVSDRCQPNKSLGVFHNLARKLLYPKASGVIVQTKKAYEIYQQLIPKARIKIIGNPVRTNNNYSELVKENIVLSVGRLIKTKNHDVLIKIFVKINKPEWKLLIIGDNIGNQQYRRQLQELIKKLNAENIVILLGSLMNVDDYYKKSKIFAFASSSEGFPNVIGEAMSAGLPVIAFDCIAGPSEMINDGVNGFLIPFFDQSKFQDKLQILMDNQILRHQLADQAKKSIKEFSTASIGHQYLDYILKSENSSN